MLKDGSKITCFWDNYKRIKIFKIIGATVFVAAFGGYFLREKLQIDYLNLLLIALLFVGSAIFLVMNNRVEKLNVKAGNVKLAGKGHHFIELEQIVFVSIGVIILVLSIPEMIQTKKVDPINLLYGLILPIASYLNITRCFLIVKASSLKLKGVEYKYSKIDLVQLFDSAIRLQMGTKSKDITLDKLSAEEKKEVFETLRKSPIGDKVKK